MRVPPIPMFLALCLLLPSLSHAEAVSILGRASIFAPTRALVQARLTPPPKHTGASLFTGRGDSGLFAKPRAAVALSPPMGPALHGSRIEKLRQLIGHAESRRHGYDAVQHGARVKPPDRPTQLTLGQIDTWIDATPGQPHAIGKFQFIPPTLRRLVRRLGLGADTRFSPAIQDRLADELLREAGLDDVGAGRISRHAFMENLAKIWAGLPTSTGKSYYDGHAGNKASMTWADYDARMAQLFP
ncbi:hypothetical protein [Oceaniglobus indicus]|uniref:hypothetical protein n=1 Tax=Oceaniglobus indicus TaxID=2047749 RepID=UPI001F4E0BE8|nr:hypothetical protein [Oceaniglobus indicus]